MNRDDCTCSELVFELSENAKNYLAMDIGEYILGPELDHAGTRGLRSCKQCREIQIMGKDDSIFVRSPLHYGSVMSIWSTHVCPVHCIVSILL